MIFFTILSKVFNRVCVPNSLSLFVFKVLEKLKKIKSLRILVLFFIYLSIKEFFSSIFFVFSFSKALCTHMLEHFNLNLSFRILYYERLCL